MPVKEERADEAEIADLARKIAEVNRQKIIQHQQLLLQQQAAALHGHLNFVRSGQQSIH